jgi:hypothetical protein
MTARRSKRRELVVGLIEGVEKTGHKAMRVELHEGDRWAVVWTVGHAETLEETINKPNFFDQLLGTKSGAAN